MRRTFLLAWPLDRRAGTSRQPLRERTGGRGAIRGSLPTRRDARIPQSPSQAPVTAPFRQGGHCGLLKRRPVCAGRRGRHPSSAGHPQDDMAGSGTIRGIAPYGRGKDGRPHPALRATCPPCGARKTVRAYADPPVFRPLRKKSPRFFRPSATSPGGGSKGCRGRQSTAERACGGRSRRHAKIRPYAG